MTRRELNGRLLVGGGLALAAWGGFGPGKGWLAQASDADGWREILPAERYRILFKDGTEPAWSSPLNDEKRDGTYICAACYQPLFSSADKFDSGTGWPSFTRPISAEAIGTRRDFKLIWPRTEYHCANCGGHQGHVFDDGPEPTGQRWCNNGLALEFIPDGQDLPPLRSPGG